MKKNAYRITETKHKYKFRKENIGEKQLYNLYMFDFFIYMYMKIIHLNIHPFYSSAPFKISGSTPCLLYTSDAADDMQCVDLGGRRIIKK